MCINKKWIINRYTKKRVLVNCGHCEACQQEKAQKRTLRINFESRFNTPVNWVTLHCTLTYDNDNIPFIRDYDYDDFMNEKINAIPVYRSMEKRYCFKRVKKDGKQVYKKRPMKIVTQIDSFDGYDGRGKSDWLNTCADTYPVMYRYKYGKPLEGRKLPHIRTLLKRKEDGSPVWKYSYNKIGVIYYKDIQDFIKRLREYLRYNYKYEDYENKVVRKNFDKVDEFRFFSCSELGPDSYRPHFHLLLHFDKKYLTEFKQAISACWQFDNIGSPDSIQFNRQVKLHNRGASYVSSYVNRSACFPTFFATFRPFSPRHCYSHGYGMVSSYCTLPYLLACARQGRFVYERVIKVGGVECIKSFPLPSFVVRRYFPYFKGYSRIDDVSLYRFMQRCWSIYKDAGFKKKLIDVSDLKFLDYDENDLKDVVIRLCNAAKRFAGILGFNRDDAMLVYADNYIRVLNRYYSFLNIYSYEQIENPQDFIYHFDNWYDGKDIHSLVVDTLPLCDVELQVNVNDYPCNVSRTGELTELFHLYKKKKKVKNIAFSLDSNV